MKPIASLLFSLCLLLCWSSLSVPRLYADPSSTILITGVYFDPYIAGETSEAIQIQNISPSPINISNWTVNDDQGSVSFPAGAVITPNQKVWATHAAAAFESEFGFAPNYEYGGNSDANVPDMTGSSLDLRNSGDVVILKNSTGDVVDAVPYGDQTLTSPDWSGGSVHPYYIAARSTEGQILYRKLREDNGLPFPDTDTAPDWAEDASDNLSGKRVQYPGWNLDEFAQTAKATENANVKYCVAPDNLFNCYRDEILSATQTISIEIYSLDNAAIVDALTSVIGNGVRVSVLADASALTDQGRWACQQLEAIRGGNHGECWLMDSKPWANVAQRYANLHAKWGIIDHAKVLIGSENAGDDAMPYDDMRDGTLGARGGYLVTDSPTLVGTAQAIMDRDFDPAHHPDIRHWGTFANDNPPKDFVPNRANGGNTYPIHFPNTLTLTGTLSFELVQCPENCLRSSDALLGLVARAAAGDTLYVEQLYEYKYWGTGPTNPASDPNLRLEAYLAAARRGAKVRILLDLFFDDFSNPRSNFETCRYVNQLASQYDVECRLGNPTGLGIHNKLVLLGHDATGWVHLGSINGSETSNKLNRELATQVQSRGAYDYWAQVFDYDWSVSHLSPHELWLPLFIRRTAP